MRKLHNNNFKEFWDCIILLALFLFANHSWAVLAKGDIAVIGYNSDGVTTTKDFAVVTLAKISSGETIFITDKGWTATSGGSFMADITTEGIFSWTVTSDIARGTVIRFAVTSGASPSVVATPSVGTLSVVNGWTSTATTSPFGTNGDQILIFQGSTSSASFIFGFNAGVFAADIVNGWNTTATSGNASSNLPAGLTNGTNAVSFTLTATALDNWAYVGTFTGSKAAVLAEICDHTKWAGDDVNTYNIIPGSVGGQFPGTNPIFVVNSIPTAANVNVSGTLQIGQVLTGSYLYADLDSDPESGTTYKWYRSDNAGGTNKVALSATGQTYTLIAADQAKFISFEVTPRDGMANGTNSGPNEFATRFDC
jgi:large repetitive protein